MNVARSSCRKRLQHVDLGDLLLGGAVQRVLDRLAQLVDERVVAVQERDAAREHLGRDDGRAVLLGDGRDDDEDAVRARACGGRAARRRRRRRCPRRRRRSCPPCTGLPKLRAVGVDLQRGAVLGAEDVLRRHADGLRRAAPWISIRLKSPWTGITYFGRVRLIIILTSSA